MMTSDSNNSASAALVLVSRTIPSPVGDLYLVASIAGIRAVLWPDDGPGRVALPSAVVEGGEGHPLLDQAEAELVEYFAGDRRGFDVPLDPQGTEFQLEAWQALRAIPYAHTVSYGEQAAQMGDKNKARAVGAANGKNPISIIVPCHRVVGSNGSLTGFAGGIDAKRWLLDHERRSAGLTPV